MKKNIKKTIRIFLTLSLLLVGGNFCYSLFFTPLARPPLALASAPDVSEAGCIDPLMDHLASPDFSYQQNGANSLLPCCVNQQDGGGTPALTSSENIGLSRFYPDLSIAAKVSGRTDGLISNFILPNCLPPPECGLIASTILRF